MSPASHVEAPVHARPSRGHSSSVAPQANSPPPRQQTETRGSHRSSPQRMNPFGCPPLPADGEPPDPAKPPLPAIPPRGSAPATAPAPAAPPPGVPAVGEPPLVDAPPAPPRPAFPPIESDPPNAPPRPELAPPLAGSVPPLPIPPRPEPPRPEPPRPEPLAPVPSSSIPAPSARNPSKSERPQAAAVTHVITSRRTNGSASVAFIFDPQLTAWKAGGKA